MLLAICVCGIIDGPKRKRPLNPSDDADSDPKSGNSLQLSGDNQSWRVPTLKYEPLLESCLPELRNRRPSLRRCFQVPENLAGKGLSGAPQTLILALGSFPSGS